ncbi:hypothetical protein Bpfe_020585 [Biomphalaria pfeifferi]|uniref:Uncharacterized protein n=1 Tax=Biomphalaria pfeifferi TaxID=112525 RepID=A0AAD8B9Y0_BIOPF|nr:hypothetical protein Bpfe_020585 [Biomphalaria pfeifferi]
MTTQKDCDEETNTEIKPYESSANKFKKEFTTEESCTKKCAKIRIAKKIYDKENKEESVAKYCNNHIKDAISEESDAKENEKQEFVQEPSGKNNIHIVNTEVVKEEITMNETEESYDFITEEEILEANAKQTKNVNVTGEVFADVTRNKNTEIGDSALKHPKENTGNENTMQGNELEVRKDDKAIKEPKSEYNEKGKITRKYTISDFDNLKHVPQKENNKIDDAPTIICSLFSCFSKQST